MVENLRKMQELRAQIQAQLKLADTLKKLNENAGLILCLAWFRVEIVPKSDTLKKWNENAIAGSAYLEYGFLEVNWSKNIFQLKIP